MDPLITFAELVEFVFAGSVYFLLVIMGLVEAVRRAGVSGVALLYSSLVIGLLLGIGYLVATFGAPVAFAGWFLYALAGLLYGLIASGIVDLARRELGNGN